MLILGVLGYWYVSKSGAVILEDPFKFIGVNVI